MKIRTKITTEMIEAGCSVSADVYHGKVSKQQAIKNLETNFGMNRGTASDFIVNFKKMMDGEKYTRTNNAEHTDYLLNFIFKTYGSDKLANAIKAANEHVGYYEGLGKTKLYRIRDIISQHERNLITQTEIVYPDELVKSETLLEGLQKTVLVNTYERNPVARAKCIEHYGVQCVVCGFDFEKIYGDIGKGFIHVHHLTKLSDIGQSYEINPVNDLRPVCPNCHSMLHKRNPPYEIAELKLKK
jgi:5-methylcytosine-specific restriction enzyme A